MNDIYIRYVFLKNSGDPDEIVDVTLKQSNVPRIGELLSFSIPISDDEVLARMGRVDDVTWKIFEDRQDVTVFII